MDVVAANVTGISSSTLETPFTTVHIVGIKYTRAFLKPYHVLLKPSCPQLTDRRAICTTTAAHACGVYQLSEEKDESS